MECFYLFLCLAACFALHTQDNDGVPDSVDLDDDGDGLIEIRTLAELNNVRYNLDGNGYRTTEQTAFEAVFFSNFGSPVSDTGQGA